MSVNTFFVEKIKSNFPFEITSEQLEALTQISNFIISPSTYDSAFLLKGYAGTGKSSLIGALVKTMAQFQQKTILLAPTGRAAKVFSTYAGQPASTIHKKIYRQKQFSGELTGFVQTNNLHKDTLFIVDEASMISNDSFDSNTTGINGVLDDLIHFVYGGQNCKLLLIGDDAQLPPVMQTYSPALQEEVLRGYGLEVSVTSLTQIVRQAYSSGILFNATYIRNLLHEGSTHDYPQLKLNGFADIVRVSGEELIEAIGDAYNKYGVEETMIVSRSNKRANVYNEGVRNRILYREEELSTGDMLMITKNNYFWTEKIDNIEFLANGELMEVIRVKGVQELYGFRFCDVLVRHPDYDIEIDLKVLLDTLHSENTGLSKEKNSELFYNIMADYENVPQKAKRIKRMKSDPYYNALQVKYGYAITCHKAQGGEWKNIFLDIGYITEQLLNENFYRWLYTAITRATEKLFLVNLPDKFIED